MRKICSAIWSTMLTNAFLSTSNVTGSSVLARLLEPGRCRGHRQPPGCRCGCSSTRRPSRVVPGGTIVVESSWSTIGRARRTSAPGGSVVALVDRRLETLAATRRSSTMRGSIAIEAVRPAVGVSARDLRLGRDADGAHRQPVDLHRQRRRGGSCARGRAPCWKLLDRASAMSLIGRPTATDIERHWPW